MGSNLWTKFVMMEMMTHMMDVLTVNILVILIVRYVKKESVINVLMDIT